MSTNRPFLSNFLAAFRAHSATLPKAGGSSLSTNPSSTAASVWTATTFQGATQQSQAMGTLSAPRSINPHNKTPTGQPQQGPSATTAGATGANGGRRSTSPQPAPALQHTVSPRTHGARATSSSQGSADVRSNPFGPASSSSSEPRRIPGTAHSSANMATVGGSNSQNNNGGSVSASSGSSSPAGFRSPTARRRGSDSSSEGGFRDVAASRGGEMWYVGGRTAGGEERYYKLSLVRRERSADRLSADRLSL